MQNQELVNQDLLHASPGTELNEKELTGVNGGSCWGSFAGGLAGMAVGSATAGPMGLAGGAVMMAIAMLDC